jgi:hypothetical protein
MKLLAKLMDAADSTTIANNTDTVRTFPPPARN